MILSHSAVIQWDFVSLFRSVITFGKAPLGTMTANGKITITLQVREATPITARDATMCGSRQRGVYALPAAGPRAVITCWKNPITLEVVYATMVTTWLPPAPLPLRLASHVYSWIWDSNCQLAVFTDILNCLVGRFGQVGRRMGDHF